MFWSVNEIDLTGIQGLKHQENLTILIKEQSFER